MLLPERMDVGIVCCRRSTNRNILSPAGRNPNLSARVTIPRPAGGTRIKRPKIIAAVVRIPSFELPGPGKCKNKNKVFLTNQEQEGL